VWAESCSLGYPIYHTENLVYHQCNSVADVIWLARIRVHLLVLLDLDVTFPGRGIADTCISASVCQLILPLCNCTADMILPY
jgi:hypothetical protein